MDDIHHYAFLDALRALIAFSISLSSILNPRIFTAIISAEIFQIAVAQPTHPIAGFV